MSTDRLPSEPEWPQRDSVPTMRADISMVPLDDNVAIYDEVGQLLIMLNPSAYAVLDFCDGVTTFAEMVDDLVAMHAEPLDVIRTDVWQTLRKLASLGLVSEAP